MLKNNSIRSKLNQKHNCPGPLAFISQRGGYQCNQKLLHHYQHPKKSAQSSNELLPILNLYQHAKKPI